MKSATAQCQPPPHDEPLAAFIRGLQAAQGLDISAYDESFLHKALAKHLRASGFDGLAAYGEHLARHRAEAEAFQRALHIGYSEFFRNPLSFALLEQRILPNLVAAKSQAGHGEIRVWSAGCAAGQETWSLAILLDELTRAQHPPQAYRIFASDLSESELAVARAARYPASAMGNVRWRYLSEYFVKQDEFFMITPRLHARVDFSTYDLLDEASSSPQASIYGDFDLILCCNLLIYYRPPIQQQILDKICRALAPGGYLVSGETERELVARQPGLHAVAPSCAVFQDHRGIRDPDRPLRSDRPPLLSLPSLPSKVRLPPP